MQHQRPRANRDMQDTINAQYDIAFLSSYGKAFHTRDQTYMQRQEFLFRSNMAEQMARFSNIPQTNYTIIMPLGSTTQSLIMPNSNDISLSPQPRLSSFSHSIIRAHEEQQQLV